MDEKKIKNLMCPWNGICKKHKCALYVDTITTHHDEVEGCAFKIMAERT